MEVYRTKNCKENSLICLWIDQFKFSVLIVSILAWFGMILWALEHELGIVHFETDKDDKPRKYLLCWNLIVTFLLWINIMMSYNLWIKYLRASGSMLLIDRMPNTTILQMIGEWLINIISPLPFIVNDTFKNYNYKTEVYFDMQKNTPLLYAMFFWRAYHFARPIFYYCDFMSSRAFRIWKIYGHEWSFMFSIKSLFKRSSAFITFVLMLFYTIYFGAMIRQVKQ